jgi:hypothetical protein
MLNLEYTRGEVCNSRGPFVLTKKSLKIRNG